MDRRIIGFGIVAGALSLAAVASAEEPKPVVQTPPASSQAPAPAKVKKASTHHRVKKVKKAKKASGPSAAAHTGTTTATEGKKAAGTASTGVATAPSPAK